MKIPRYGRRKSIRSGASIALAVVAVCFTGSDAYPDNAGNSRSLKMEVHTSHAQMVLLYLEPPGPRAQRVLELYDSDDNGKIDGTESAFAKKPMLRRAQSGLNISYSGAMSAPKDPQVRFRTGDDGSISMATYQRIDFVTKKGEFSVDISMSRAKSAPPTSVELSAVQDWTFKDGSTQQTRTLEGGSTERFFLVRVEHDQPDEEEMRKRGKWEPPSSTRP